MLRAVVVMPMHQVQYREEIAQRETKDSTQRMRSALAAHREHEANGTSMFFISIIILLHVTLSLLLTMLGTVPGRGLRVLKLGLLTYGNTMVFRKQVSTKPGLGRLYIQGRDGVRVTFGCAAKLRC